MTGKEDVFDGFTGTVNFGVRFGKSGSPAKSQVTLPLPNSWAWKLIHQNLYRANDDERLGLSKVKTSGWRPCTVR
jgi:hypothetical protein